MGEGLSILITAADVSGDAHAAGLIQALRRRAPTARFVGVGGEKMAAAGCDLLERPADRSAMLLGGTVAQLAYYHKLIGRVRRAIREKRPAVHVPVDSPALNWHLAAAAKKAGAPVVYYIAPQVWAWAPWRVGKLRRLTDAVACILPFEQPYLRSRGVNARYVGHPLFDRMPPANPPDLDEPAASGRWRIALLAGSRQGEIRGHAPALAAVADGLARKFPDAELTFLAPDEQAAEWIRAAANRSDLHIVAGRTQEALARAHFAVTKSGTVTLEAAHFGVPMAVFYRVNRLGYNLLGRWLLRTPNVALVNILAGRELAPELVPWYGDAGPLLRQAERMLADVEGLKRLRRELMALVAPLRTAPPATAADNAAQLVLAAVG